MKLIWSNGGIKAEGSVFATDNTTEQLKTIWCSVEMQI